MTLWLLIIAALAHGDSQKPLNLTGHWVAAEGYSVKDGREAFCDGECEIEQTAQLLTVRRRRPGAAVATYRLDGKPVRTVLQSGAYTTEVTTTATWSDGTLVIVVKTGSQPATRMTVSIAQGQLTVVGVRRSFDRRGPPKAVTYFKQTKK